jgi:signal transduction histidine kinase
MKKLLNKPLRAFTTYALIVLLCSIPVYFFIIDSIWIHEIRARNLIVAAEVKKNLVSQKFNDEEMLAAMKIWNSVQPEAKIRKANVLKVDSTYNIYRKNRYLVYKGYDRFEGLVSYFEINGKPYSLTVEANVEESYETILVITTITILFFIIMLVGFVKINKKISKSLWKPFYSTLEQIKNFDLNMPFKVSVDHNEIIEFEELNTSINRLIDSNVTVFRQQKEFTENASHELQTPLAIVQSKLDLLLQDSSISSAQSQIIEETNYALSRVGRINKNLLLLAKIENQQFLEKQSVDVSQLTQQIIELLADLLGEKTMAYKRTALCFVEGNIMLIEIMITNILMNALRYTPDNAEISISLSENEIIISNPGTFALDKNKIFKRFSAASIHAPGSGLGLAIVKEICKRYGWAVDYDFIGGLHMFKITFVQVLE